MSPATATSIAKNQLRQIRSGGLPVLWKKVGKTLELTVWPLLWGLAVPFIMLLRPLVLIRVGSILSWRIGHFGSDVAYYLAERALGMYPKRSFDLFCFHGKPANEMLATVTGRHMPIWPGVGSAVRIFSKIPFGKKHLVEIKSVAEWGYFDVEGVLDRTPRAVFLTDEEQDNGWRLLKERWGIERDAPLVCVQVRSSRYLEHLFEGAASKSEYRERNLHKNADVETFLPAMGALAEKGFHCFRMGAVPDSPLSSTSSHIIDYANDGRTDFMDIFLAANCEFFISTGSGVDSLADLFRKPVVFCNQATVEAVHAWLANITIFKHQRDMTTGEFLTFPEIRSRGTGTEFDARGFERRGVELVNNSPEEITTAVMEMVSRLEGSFVETQENDNLQERFWALLNDSSFRTHRVGWIGADYLRSVSDRLG